MDQNGFKKILDKYLSNSCTPEERLLVEEWFQMIDTGELKAVSEGEEERLFQSYKEDLQKILGEREAKTSVFTSEGHLWLKLAAMVLIILGPLLYIYVLYDKITTDHVLTEMASVTKTAINTESSAYTILLSDGSEVILNPGSNLTYKSRFEAGIREVHLEGEAFFKVAEDPSSPFVVKTGELVARVLGTSFTVKTNQLDGNIVVTVKTGRVSVEQVSSDSLRNSEPELLSPNQQAIYNIHERSISRKELEDPKISIPPVSSKRHRLIEAPIGEILRTLEKTSRTRIKFEESNFNGCLLSTSISPDEDVFYRLAIICKAIGATYRVDGISIVVAGKSCNQAVKPKQNDMSIDP